VSELSNRDTKAEEEEAEGKIARTKWQKYGRSDR